MKMGEPIGPMGYGPLIIRLTIGSYFVIAGFLKLENLPAFITEIQGFNMMPAHLATLYGTLLPYIEIGGGSLLILGFWTTMASMLCSLMLLSFIVALKPFPNANYLFNKDIILLAATVSLMYTGAGALSLDKFRQPGGK